MIHTAEAFCLTIPIFMGCILLWAYITENIAAYLIDRAFGLHEEEEDLVQEAVWLASQHPVLGCPEDYYDVEADVAYLNSCTRETEDIHELFDLSDVDADTLYCDLMKLEEEEREEHISVMELHWQLQEALNSRR